MKRIILRENIDWEDLRGFLKVPGISPKLENAQIYEKINFWKY